MPVSASRAASCALILIAFLGATAPSRAQNATAPVATAPTDKVDNSELSRFLNGRRAPLDLKLSQMKRGWQTLAPAAPMGRPNEFWAALQTRFGGDATRAFTRGQNMRWSGEDYLVIYRAKFPTNQESQRWFEAHSDTR